MSTATSRNNAPSPAPLMAFTALFELIFVRSLAMPDNAWAAITKVTDTHSCQPGCVSVSANRATICSPRPATSVRLSPVREPTHPPSRFVRMPMNSYARNRKAIATGE